MFYSIRERTTIISFSLIISKKLISKNSLFLINTACLSKPSSILPLILQALFICMNSIFRGLFQFSSKILLCAISNLKSKNSKNYKRRVINNFLNISGRSFFQATILRANISTKTRHYRASEIRAILGLLYWSFGSDKLLQIH